jgi:hypothetical protein
MPKAVECLFTIVTDYQGATLIEQIRATGLKTLLEKWRTQTQAPIRLSAAWDLAEMPVPLEGLKNAWCICYEDDNEVFFLVNIIETADPESASGILRSPPRKSIIPFEAGQLWAYRKFREESYSKILILAVEEVKGERIVHLTVVDGNVDAPLHMPFSERAVRRSVTMLLGHATTLPDFDERYGVWKVAFEQDEAGVYDVPVAEVLEM